ASCTPTENTNTNTNNSNRIVAASPSPSVAVSPSPRHDDATFAADAAQSNTAEIALGRLAAQKAKNPEVKKFTQRLIADHSKALAELKQIATRKNITLPADVKPEQKQTHDRLSSLSGAEFDREFMTVMVEGHQKSATNFQAEANNGTDPDLKALAAKILPIIQEHLRMAREISGKLQ